MRHFRFLYASIAARLFWQTLILSAVPMLIIAVVVTSLTAGAVRSRLEDEGAATGRRVSADLAQTAATTSTTAILLAQSTTLRSLVDARDAAGLNDYLSSIQTQLGVEQIDVAGANGSLLASTAAPGEKPADGGRQGTASTTPPTWTLLDHPQGIMLRAQQPIEGISGGTDGTIGVGVLIGAHYLDAEKAGAREELALIDNQAVRASTVPFGGDGLKNGQTRKPGSLTIGSARYLPTFQTLGNDTGKPATLLVLTPLSTLSSTTTTLWLLFSGLILCMCLVSAIWAQKMVRSILAPFSRIVPSFLRVRDGDLAERIQPTSGHEIEALEMAFNGMLDSLEGRERERAIHEAELVYRAAHDSLTGLPNRSLFQEKLDAAATDADRYSPSALLYIDFDHFKLVNDTLGHASGDRLLSQLAVQLASVLRPEDLLARLGGDEFAVLLPDLFPRDAAQMADRIRRLVNDFRFTEAGQSFAVGVSVGVTAVKTSASETLKQADIACYAAKLEGRNRVHVYEHSDATVDLLSDDRSWVLELRDALRENRLHLVFQPVVRIKSRSVDHYEAFVRLVDRTGAIVQPRVFLPAAERSGLIREIDHWVLNAALQRMQEENSHSNPVRLSINLAASTLAYPDASESIRRSIELRGVDPHALTIEITEAALRKTNSEPPAAIEALRAMGCSITLDGFGAESPSFARLPELPVDSVKIDGSFVRDASTNSKNRSIVRAIALIVHSLGKPLTAKSVEDCQTLAMLRRLNVDFAQGYFIGYPSSDLGNSYCRPRRTAVSKLPVRGPKSRSA